ncbi:Glutaryl-7-aminocephalosporanic-acid acylase [Halomicronema hongdechloris C2206]|uniref:Glutaryl-7-aminocephalosporanic-acid acylase n=1 Tax=Halomicronema hongdechloris C2206 TaxID=1641165 RepID=A0A1Z3HLS2_9CYAN|nr:acylase [Halomicronema hongdechloris]ASC71047.1 Glutaryl-7-aminocephalosporanic-acid acylase [Halomicronema hongdechloris C2206]
MRRLIWVLLGGALALLIGVSWPLAGTTATEILWDTYGVPHIYADDTEELFRAFGWAQAQSHGDLILRLYGQARGRAAEYWGEDYLDSDRWVHTMGIPSRAQAWYEAQTPQFQTYLDAFAAGVNAYAQTHEAAIADEVEAVLPISGVDLLAHGQRVLNFTFVVNPQQVAALATDDSAAAMALPTPGSNGWAIAPQRSASGEAMLLANPHLPWSEAFRWYEAHLIAPDLNVYGASLVGIPVLNIAFNDQLGWTHTVNLHDGWDAYQLRLTEDGYWFDGQMRPFEVSTQALQVKQADGTLQPKTLTIRRSLHGPVVQEQGDTAIALRVVGLEHPGALEQWWQMGRAHTLAEFEAALQRLQIPMFTVLYADRQGHILHLFNGHVPVRSGGDVEDWSGLLPGDTSDTLWSEIHAYSELPRLLDPPTGWLQNANDPPWTTTLPPAIDPDDYPTYIAPLPSMDSRAQRSARMLAEDQQISFEEMVKYKHSPRMELADRLLDDLIPAARQQGRCTSTSGCRCPGCLGSGAAADSRAAVLFATWARQVDLERLFATPWDENAPLSTPAGLADPAGAVAALEAAAAQVQTAYGALDIAWGDVFRLRSGPVDLPASGGPGHLGIFRNLWFAPEEDGTFTAVGGDSYVAAVEFSDPVRAMAVMTYGNATQASAPRQQEQLDLAAQQQLRPVWLSRAAIEANLVVRESF